MEVSHKPLWGTASLNNSEAAAGCSSDNTVTISRGSARIVPLEGNFLRSAQDTQFTQPGAIIRTVERNCR